MPKSILAAAVIAAAALSTPAQAEEVAATIIAMERAALDRSDTGDVKGFLEISAEDVVYQDPALDKPIEGLAALTAYYAKFPDGGEIRGEMQHATVQAFGDVAVLSFHYVSRLKEKIVREWNCTEVYRKTEGHWRIVNTHWSLSKPLLQNPL